MCRVQPDVSLDGSAVSYAVITPARNEALNLPRLAECLSAQTLPPCRWVIVDNGSTDETFQVATEIANLRPWAHVMSVEGTRAPTRGAPVVHALQEGIASLTSVPPDVVVKLDADVTVGSDYFERLMREFALDSSLGMASGVGYQLEREKWRLHHVTAGHVWGPARAYRWQCLPDVLPLERAMGWDAVDEVKARLAGWTTRNFPDLGFRHHRPLGLRDGTRRRQWIHQGRAAHYVGYRPSYLVLRALFRAREERWALAMVWGYLVAAISRAPQCADANARAYVRRHQRLRNIVFRAREVLELSWAPSRVR